MKTLLKSFIPFTILLIAIVCGVLYSDSLAQERSETFVAKSLKVDAPAPEAQPMLLGQNTQ